jgi:hypothetical protein
VLCDKSGRDPARQPHRSYRVKGSAAGQLDAERLREDSGTIAFDFAASRGS